LFDENTIRKFESFPRLSKNLTESAYFCRGFFLKRQKDKCTCRVYKQKSIIYILMKFNLSKVKFSRKDISNKIKIPDKLTNELAYLIGFHLGDGTLPYSKKKDYYVAYTGHIIDDLEWYKSFLI